jgi:hypothetical protein
LVLLACLVVVPVDFAGGTVFVVASLTDEDQFSIVHLARVATGRKAVSIVWVLCQSTSVSEALVFLPGPRICEDADLILLKEQ